VLCEPLEDLQTKQVVRLKLLAICNLTPFWGFNDLLLNSFSEADANEKVLQQSLYYFYCFYILLFLTFYSL